MPDIQRGTAVLLQGRTDAEERCTWAIPRAPSRPRIHVEHAGSIGTQTNLVERARIYLHAYGRTPSEARRLAYQARDVILPPGDITDSISERISYEDEEGATRTIKFSGAALETGPREAPDDRTRVITSYLIYYHA